MAEVVKVTYIGPNADSDPRTLSVSPDEAERLVKTGLYKMKPVKKSTTTKGAANA